MHSRGGRASASALHKRPLFGPSNGTGQRHSSLSSSSRFGANRVASASYFNRAQQVCAEVAHGVAYLGRAVLFSTPYRSTSH
jgi:hypothetical protein